MLHRSLEIIAWPGTVLHVDKKTWLTDVKTGKTVSDVKEGFVLGIQQDIDKYGSPIHKCHEKGLTQISVFALIL